MHTVLGHGVKVGLIGEATLRHESAIAGRMTDQLICSGKIDGEVSQITVIYSDEARLQLECTVQFVSIMYFDQCIHAALHRSEEHTSELQSLMRISYAVFCLKKKNKTASNKYINALQTQLRQYNSHSASDEK